MSITGLSLRRRASYAMALTLGLVALADWLFYKQPVGWNTALFGVALIAAVLLRDGRAMRTWAGRAIAAACGGLVVALAIEPGPLPICMGMLGLVTLAIIDRNGLSAGAALWLGRWAMFIARTARQPLHDARTARRRDRSRGNRYPGLMILLRWFVPAALSLIFVGLFALANPIIADWTSNLPSLLAPLRVLLWLTIGFAVWGLLRTRLRGASTEWIRGPAGPDRIGDIEAQAGANWITRSLVLFNAVFAVQTVLDLIYLYGGATLPDGMTYAQYAHRGAYPLIATALLAAAFVLLTFRPGGLAQRSGLARRLVYLWIAQNVMLVVSSVWRLSLYVDVYSLTRWRVAAGVWMALVAIALVLLVVRIATRRSNRWLVQANTAVAVLVLYVCCFVGFDRLIAEYNVRHSREVVMLSQPVGETALLHAPLDVAYLEHLGPSAVPALRWYLAQTAQSPALPSRRDAREAVQRLESRLDDQLINWRGWTLTRLQLAGVGLKAR